MRLYIIACLLVPLSARASLPPAGPEASALRFNQWYLSQLQRDRNPLTDYQGLSPYVTEQTIKALLKSNQSDPEIVDVADIDMFIKAQDIEDDWQEINVVSSDYDPVCMQVYITFGTKHKHTVIDCMVKEKGIWKVNSVAGQAISPNSGLKSSLSDKKSPMP